VTSSVFSDGSTYNAVGSSCNVSLLARETYLGNFFSVGERSSLLYLVATLSHQMQEFDGQKSTGLTGTTRQEVDAPSVSPSVSRPVEAGASGAGRGRRGDGFFWVGHNTRDYLTNEYESPFDVDGVKFASVSWYMWYRRAKMWKPEGDLAVLIREARTVSKAKQLSRRCTTAPAELRNAWLESRLKVMAKAVLRKFECSDELGRKLVETASERLVFASQYDAFHGIGMTMVQGRERRDEWGKNYLGQILELVRKRLAKCRER
jgi:ribA/ribD-fused uncharacterized protein